MPMRGRCSEPEKIMSSVRLPRRAEKLCSPSTQRSASATLDLPLPLGPTIAVTPASNRNSVREANVL